MSDYFSLISYPAKDSLGVSINLQDENEQARISDALYTVFAVGKPNHMRDLKEVKSWSINYDSAYNIWTQLPNLYRCEDYGEIRYIPADDVAHYINLVTALVKDVVWDVEKLIHDGTLELNMLIEFHTELRKLSEQTDRYILFSWC